MVKTCHRMAKEKYMDVALENKDLSIEIEGKIEIGKLGTSARNIVGQKYLKENLMKKYKIEPEEVYLNERSKAIVSSTEYVVKTVNGLNLHSDNERNRGDITAECPVCGQREDWTTQAKSKLIHDIEVIPKEDIERNDMNEINRKIHQFLFTKEYDIQELKMLMRGWIKTSILKQEVSKWALEVIKKLIRFYHQCWTLRNKCKFDYTKEAKLAIQKETLLEKIYSVYDSRETIFYREEDQYIDILFQWRKEEWTGTPTVNMKKWLITYYQVVKQQCNSDFDFDVREYFTFEEAVTFWTDVV